MSNARYITGASASVLPYTGTSFTVPTTPLTALTGTVLLTCQSNRFIDNSSNAFAITRNGNTSTQAFSPFNPTEAWDASTNGGSGYFDGSGDYLTVANNAALYFDTGDFTIECWINTSATIAYQTIASVYGTPTINNGWYFSLNATGVGLYFSFCNGSTSSLLDAGSGLNDGAWHHVAAVRTGTALSLYIDGARVATTTNSYNITSTANLRISGYAGTSRDWNGFISDFRIIKGSGPYDAAQSTLTVPTAPLTAITNTSLLTNFTNAGIGDYTAKNDLETVGNSQISTAQYKWGDSSMYFDGTGDYLLVPSTSLWDFGTGDFTVEFWINFSSVGNDTIVGKWGSGAGKYAWVVQVTASNLVFYTGNNGTLGTQYTFSWTAATGNWYHVAVARSGTSLKAFVNGTQIGTTQTNSHSLSATGAFCCIGENLDGGGQGGYINGYLQDLRITKGYARYTTGFTPPTAAFPLT